MGTAISVFPVDRSRRWIIAPGVASTRQVQVRNDSAEPVELHFKTEEPAAASVSPIDISLKPRQSRNLDVIFLADWSPEKDKRLLVSVRDQLGNVILNFAQEIIAADSSDCSVVLSWKEPIVIDGMLSGLKFFCTLTSRSSTARTFEVDFTPHAALRFPERKKVTLEPGESSTFEVPVEWHRNVHDTNGWNHPRVVEVTVPVSQGRRTAVMLWEAIEPHIERHLTDEDRAPMSIAPPDVSGLRPFPGYVVHPGDEEYQKLLAQKQLEQAVVAPGQARGNVGLRTERAPIPRKAISASARGMLALAVIALIFAAIFFVRMQEPDGAHVAYSVSPVPLASFPVAANRNARRASHATPKPLPSATAAAALAASAAAQPAAILPPRRHPAHASAAAAAAAQASAIVAAHVAPPVDRSVAVVALADPDVAYASGGRAVAIRWYVQAQDHAVVHLLNERSKIIAQSSIAGNRSHALVNLPRGYHGGVSVEVIAIGYHGERVVQSASLAPLGG